MPFAIEALFDLALDAAVRAVWQRLTDAGLGDFLQRSGSQPHVSLAGYRELHAEYLSPVLASVARAHQPMEVTLAAVGTFPGNEGVVFLAPVVTDALLALHQHFHASVDAAPKGSAVAPSPYYRPGAWFPHCTVGYGVPAAQIGPAVALVRGAPLPLAGRLTALTLVEVPAMRHLATFALGSGERLAAEEHTPSAPVKQAAMPAE